jgi:hypothetical protein
MSVAHSEEVSGFVLCKDEATRLGSAPALCHVGSQSAARSVLHHNAQMIRRQNCFIHIYEIDVTRPQLRLTLHISSHLFVTNCTIVNASDQAW